MQNQQLAAIIAQQIHLEAHFNVTVMRNRAVPNEPPKVIIPPILLQAIIELADKTKEGQLVTAVGVGWLEIVRLILRDPRAIYQLHPRQWEALIAGAWEREGWEVTLTPRSGDGGRDVIATLPGAGRVRLFDQVKRYGEGHRVTADEVRSMLGVLTADGNVSKGFVTTTSEFAPGIEQDPNLLRLMPHRLELRSREPVLAWLEALAMKP